MKERAKNYAIWGMRSTNFQKKSSKSFLWFYFLFAAIALCLSREIWFICVVVTLLTADVVCVIVFYIKWNPITGFISFGTQMLSFGLYFDLLCYGIYYCTGLFVWYEFVISACAQTVSLVVGIPMAKLNFKKFKDDGTFSDYKKRSALGSSIGGFTCVTTMLICRFFMADIALNVWVTFISLVVNIIVFLSFYSACLNFHVAYLIRKYKIDLQTLIEESRKDDDVKAEQ